MEVTRLSERISEFQQALSQLRKALAQPKNEYIRDSVIQRFEFTYELAWKMLKLKLAFEGIEATTPRAVFQEALQAGFIHDGNLWTDLQKMRNLSSHTYDEKLAEQVYDFVSNSAVKLFTDLQATTQKWPTN
jgi:nucleotidyltransferase substrate binding protein (TIGR01987 family)